MRLSSRRTINYLLLIGEFGILPRLYSRVAIPDEVFIELMDEGAPPEVRQWIAHHPDCLVMRGAPGRDPRIAQDFDGRGTWRSQILRARKSLTSLCRGIADDRRIFRFT